ncbi:MAG: M20/M25/M40 family metallo-hydrolase [Roseivirga sp.]
MNLSLFKSICEAPGPPGFEHRIRQLVIDEVKPLVDHLEVDNIGNIIAIRRGRQQVPDKRVMVAAHMDELGMIVRHIDEGGYLRFHTLGGFDPKTLTAQRVIVHGKKDLVGAMGTKAVHFMPEEERKKAPKLDDYFIDLGMPHEEVIQYVAVGDPVTRERALIEMGDCLNGKSLDNRTGVFVLIEALRALQTVPYDVYAVFTVQEEVGLRGASVAAHHINPKWGLALDTTTSSDMPTVAPHERVNFLGQGAGIKVMDSRTICDYRMVNFLQTKATAHNISWQADLKAVGGTDTAPIQRMGQDGAIAGAITIPIRYAHQAVEMVHQKDVKAAIQLLQVALEGIDTHEWQHDQGLTINDSITQ